MRCDYLKLLRDGKPLSFGQQCQLIFRMSIPAILAQISSIVMQYIDASMVGHLGANSSAAIGLVSSSTWLFGGLCSAASIGFTVQIAHQIGAGKRQNARNIMKIGLITVIIFSLLLAIIGACVSKKLPLWLGGEPAIQRDAFYYFVIYASFLPAAQINSIAGGMLQCSGNMRLPSTLNIIMCLLDVICNAVLIFPSRQITILECNFLIPGAGFGVAGAALGTAFAECITAGIMLYYLLFRSEMLRLRPNEKLHFTTKYYKKALRISLPVGAEQMILCGAYIAATKIVAPLGTIAVAANSLSVTAESLCYMPGYGIGTAITTIIGQSIGANRHDLTRRLSWMATIMGMLFMAITGVFMYFLAPFMIGTLSPDPAIQELGAAVLRIEAFAEPMYAASIVASGVFRGAGDTFIPSCLNFCSMWLVRLPLSAYLAPRFGLRGVWIAMCIELCVRGTLFLVRLARKKFDKITVQS